MTNFVHLHVHSHYSLLDGLGKVEEYVKKAKELGMKALALTDKGNVHGLIDLYKACQKEGLKAILGGEMYIALRSRFDKEAGIDNRRHQIVLLAKNQIGYENLLQLSSEAFLTGMYYKPRIDMELLRKHSEGLIAILPRVNGEIARYLLNGETGAAEKALQQYQEIFGADLYLEMLSRPKFPDDADLQNDLKEISRKMNVPLVATNDVYYVRSEDADAHDTLIAMQFTALKNDPDRFHLLDYDLSFADGEKMAEWFVDLPEALENTLKIAEQCNVEFEFGVNRIPKFPLPEDQKSEKEYLRQICLEGMQERYGFDPKHPAVETLQCNVSTKQVLERLDFELDIIGKMGFDGYFLIVWDFVRWAKKQGIAVGPGRGSAAGSLVSYLLNITTLDPLHHGLLFERFLNPERISMPDIDLDFADDRRDEVIEYVAEKYGRDHVAQICTFGTMAARAAVKDVGRVMGLPFTEMNEFGKLIPALPGTTLDQAEKNSPELKAKLEKDETARGIYDAAKKLEGNVRHVSVHACAVVIAPQPILKYSAVQHPPKDDTSIITQYSAKPLEALGLLKMDFLGLRNLTILEKAKKYIEKLKGVEIDWEKLPMDDKKTFQLLSEAYTTGVFQFESGGMRRYLKELKPTQFEDLIAMVSLYRPGPMERIPDYIACKHGKKAVSYLLPELQPLLKATYGILVYQEQVMQMVRDVAGFTPGEGYLLIKAVGKKIATLLKQQKKKFIDGCVSNGVKNFIAEKLWDFIEPFARYGFNKSHAACYALIAYQTAYLKANYPTEFFAALLSCDKDNTDRVILDIEEARLYKNIRVSPPDINESYSNFTVTKSRVIRFGLTAIKGIGESVVDEIIKARKQSGPFENFADFLARMPSKVLNKKSLEALAKSGALSEFGDPRMFLENMEEILQFVRHESTEHDENQNSLFRDEHIEKAELQLPDTEPAKLSERLRWEKEVLGIYVSGHPLQGLKQYFSEKGTPVSEIPEKMRFTKKEITIHGLCTDIRKFTTKRNEVMAIVNIEDLSGKIETVLFPKIYTAFQPFLHADTFMTVKGKAEKRNGEWQMVVESLTSQELEKIRSEADKEGLLNMQEEVVNRVAGSEEPGAGNGEKVESEENDLDVGDGLQPSHMEPTEADTPEGARFCIHLPDEFSREKMKKLNELLSGNEGDEEVEIHFHGQHLVFPLRVEVTEGLKREVEELVGK